MTYTTELIVNGELVFKGKLFPAEIGEAIKKLMDLEEILA